MADDDDNKTDIAFEAIVEDAKKRGVITPEAGYRLKRRFRMNSEAAKIVMRIVKHPLTWLSSLLAGGGSAWYFDLLNLIE